MLIPLSATTGAGGFMANAYTFFYSCSVLKTGGKALGALADIITGVWDVIEGIREIGKGSKGLGWVMVGMGAAGIATVALFALGYILWAFVVVAVIIIVSVAIMFF